MIEREYSNDESPFRSFPSFSHAPTSPAATLIHYTLAGAGRKMRNCWKRVCIYCGAPQSYRATDLTPPRPSSPPSHFLCPFEKCPEKNTSGNGLERSIYYIWHWCGEREDNGNRPETPCDMTFTNKSLLHFFSFSLVYSSRQSEMWYLFCPYLFGLIVVC